MMHKNNLIFIKVCLLLSLFGVGLLSSCSDDDNEKKGGELILEKVYRHDKTTTTKEISEARVGTMVRIEGSGLGTLREVYCNGERAYVNPTFVTTHSAIFRIPQDAPVGSEVADPEILNKIRVVTATQDKSIDFQILAAAPTIKSMSHTLPKAGDRITVYGTSLRDVEIVTFPGDIKVTEGIEWNEEGTAFSVTVPGGITKGGAIAIDGPNGKAASADNFNRHDCVFLSKYSAEPNDGLMKGHPFCKECQAGTHGYHSWGSNTSGNISDAIPSDPIGGSNPEVYRSIPEVPGSMGVLAGEADDNYDGGKAFGRYNFRSCAAAQRVIGLSNGVITSATPLDNVALQFDYYIPVKWQSGRFGFTFVDGGEGWMASYYPWAGKEKVEPIEMTGWQTATIPMDKFPKLAGQSYNFLLRSTADLIGNGDYANQGYVGFFNDTCGGYEPQVVDNFIVYFSDFRIVPNVIPEPEEDDDDIE